MPSVSSLTAQTIWPVAGMIALAVQGVYADNAAPPAGTFVQMSNGARIECVTPDGQNGPAAELAASGPKASGLAMEDDIVTCLLREGETDFVVELPKGRLLNRLTFLNRNAVARGELKIAVANERLTAASTGWVEVDGIVPFSHKRLFGVSLVGIEAKFVRLSFRVEKPGQIDALTNLESGPVAATPTARQTEKPFKTSALHDALNSEFATRHGRESIFLTSSDASVGPLSASVH